MQTICALNRFKFGSGAEEKIVRTFQAPLNFIENFKKLCSITDSNLDEIIECMFTIFGNYFSLVYREKERGLTYN